VTDRSGHAHIASGKIFIYDRGGRQIAVPERPSSMAFGGADNRILLIAARSSLYAIWTSAAGR
jgi:sugar lactone lactonase YvrE